MCARVYPSIGQTAGVLGIALMAFAGMCDLRAQQRSPPVLVRRVVDGDSIEVATIGRINLLGIAAPRTGSRSDASEPYAQQAHDRLAGLLTNRWVRLEYENQPAGSRRSAYVFLDDGRFVNEWMLREGLVRASSQQGLRRSRELMAAEAEARSAGRGLWAERRGR
jgi:endonuclease YncB( thermonuclease family)